MRVSGSRPEFQSGDFGAAFNQGLRNFKERLIEFESKIPQDTIPCRGDEYHLQVLSAFDESQAFCRDFEIRHDDTDIIVQAQQLFRQETDPWIRQSWIGNRARSKPSGFAGDYEMLVKLYDEATPARGLGGYLDLCILDLPLARAVRSRLASAREFLLSQILARGTDVRILDIASGPCREYLSWPNLAQQQVEVVALDNDPIALDYVSRTVVSQLQPPTALRPVRYNALRTRSAEATIAKFGRFDLIYSVGLCDYLTDKHLIGLLAGWRETLNENGVMYIAFKDTEQYDKTPYQWHLDWFFYQRTLDDVLALYAQAGFDTRAIQTTRDQTGIIINFITRQVSGQISRLDEASRTIPAPRQLPSHVDVPGTH